VEAHTLMMSTHNIFAPSNGKPIMSPSQDTVMGCNYITIMLADQKGEGMTFSNPTEADYAYNVGKIALHAKIKVRLPKGQKLKSGEPTVPGGRIVETTYGRILFNSILPEGMDFYNQSLRSSDLAMVISDCYQLLGRRATIQLLDDMNQLGFRESTHSGLSFGADDLVTPDTKARHITDADKKVMTFQKNYLKGVMTAQERYNQVLDAWTAAREAITKDMLAAMETDQHRGPWYVNPVFLMASSGARGGIEQIRQLAGMRGLMAKPTGEIIETPIKSNFREGLSVLEYFSSTHGARKGLADTALKTADSGYLTRKLADVAQNVVITLHDCGTNKGITKGVIYRGEKVEVRLIESITGRVSRQNIVNLITSETIVEENQMISRAVAHKIEEMGLEKIQVRSPMTCDAPLGVCRACYGMDMSTGAVVEEGMAVGIIAAQSIGEPGTQLTMRTFHIGGAAGTTMEESDIKSKKGGIVKYIKMRFVRNDNGEDVVLTRNCEIAVVDARGRELERYEIPVGARLLVTENQEIPKAQVLCEWNPHKIPILATASGKVSFVDISEGETLKSEKDPSGNIRRSIMDSRGKFHPQIVLEDADGKAVDVHYLPDKAVINVTEGKKVNAGTELAEMPREATGVRDITGGLPRITEIFEARKPKDPAVVAEIDGTVEISKDRKRGKRSILVKSDSGEEIEHLVPPGKRFLVHSGDIVKAGQALVEGPLVPHDILRVSGEEAVQQYLLHEVQQVYRSQRVEINDKHVEIIIARMLRKVKITNPGDTSLLAGLVMDRFDFKKHNDHIAKCIRVTDPGDTQFALGAIVPKEEFDTANVQSEGLGGKGAKGKKPKPAHAEVQLLGITKAAVQSNSFISAASFQETTKVLTEAALAGKVDRLVGLKENVILGHLIPAGTGFRIFQESEVSYRKEALEDLVNRGAAIAEQQNYPLLNQAPQSAPEEIQIPEPPASPAAIPPSDAPAFEE
jgi:DNA-directed RNA polymerase subunit beta'